MFAMLTFARLAGIAMVVFAAVAPVAYCTVQETKEKMSIQKACLEAKGEWTAGWGAPFCSLKEEK